MTEPFTAHIKITGMVASVSSKKEATESINQYLAKIFKTDAVGVHNVKIALVNPEYPTMADG